ncbi:MAG TPA: preprotein translocase subunit SecG [Alphaproteobacteria bacterium]|nr:preprotein translocase subunit SecG [Alphaproteobacteria bacterium]
MFSILLILLIVVAVFMIGLILLQKSEGSGMSGSSAASMFGGVLTGASAGNFLTKATAWLATIFFVLCALLAIVSSKTDVLSRQSELRQELMQGEPTAATPVAPATTEAPVQQPQPATTVPAAPAPVKK